MIVDDWGSSAALDRQLFLIFYLKSRGIYRVEQDLAFEFPAQEVGIIDPEIMVWLIYVRDWRSFNIVAFLETGNSDKLQKGLTADGK